MELNYILEGAGELIPVPMVCVVYAEDIGNNKKYSFELISPLPNSDITKVNKEKFIN